MTGNLLVPSSRHVIGHRFLWRTASQHTYY